VIPRSDSDQKILGEANNKKVVFPVTVLTEGRVVGAFYFFIFIFLLFLNFNYFNLNYLMYYYILFIL